MFRFAFGGFLLVMTVAPSPAQTLANSSLTGRYFFRQLEFSTDALGNIAGAVASLGTLTFDGAGGYSVNAFETVGNQQPTTLTGTGNYSVQSSGVLTLSNPQRNGYTVHARFGTELILGSTTESGDNTFDLFAAIPAPAAGQGANLFSGTYSFASFELQNSVAAGARSAVSIVPVGANGAISNFSATGHAANYLNGAIATQTVGGASYAIGTDGSGTISFGSTSPLVSGTKNIYVSQSGNVVLVGSPYAGGQDISIGVRQFSGTPAVANLSGLYFTGGIRLDTKYLSTEAYAGSFNGISSLAEAVTTQRLHQIGLAPGFDVTLSNPFSVGTANTLFTDGLDLLLLGINGNSFVAAGLSSTDTTGYSIDIGIRAPALTGTGVFIQPQGVVNAASLSPAGAAIAPGEFMSLFGTGLADSTDSASLPYPTTLGNTSVTVNGIAAPIAYASANQVNFLVPYGVTGSTATVIAAKSGTASNSVVMPLQLTAPGAFSVNGSGTGLGAITHAAGAIVSTSNPARRGETITIYAAGLGAVTPTPIDGAIGSGSTVNALAVTIAGQTASVTFAGLSPSYPGLYQINVLIPSNLVGTGALPLGIRTVDAFHCQVDLYVQ